MVLYDEERISLVVQARVSLARFAVVYKIESISVDPQRICLIFVGKINCRCTVYCRCTVESAVKLQ